MQTAITTGLWSISTVESILPDGYSYTSAQYYASPLRTLRLLQLLQSYGTGLKTGPTVRD
jgi:hypothetical protein